MKYSCLIISDGEFDCIDLHLTIIPRIGETIQVIVDPDYPPETLKVINISYLIDIPNDEIDVQITAQTIN